MSLFFEGCARVYYDFKNHPHEVRVIDCPSSQLKTLRQQKGTRAGFIDPPLLFSPDIEFN